MRDVLADLDRWRRDGETLAIATLVAVYGSAPRLPGARMLVTRGGAMAGSVSGGCVESDVVARAQQVMDDGLPQLMRYGIADDSELAVGLTCAEIEVLIERFDAAPAWTAARVAVERGASAVLAIAIAPVTLAGRALAIGADGATTGTIAADLDAVIVARAGRLAAAGGTEVVELPYRDETARVFVEAFVPPLRLVISGGSHTGVALARMAKQVGMHVTVIDARSAYIPRARFPDADVVRHAHPGKALAELDLDGAYVVTLTHDLKFDVPALAAALRARTAYVGAMGSLRTHARRVTELGDLGFTPAEIARIRTPIGLDLGSRTPEEIAVAILAEMLAVRSERDAQPLRDRRVEVAPARRALGFRPR
jgi:xanthine dehydrogenase accessory factor